MMNVDRMNVRELRNETTNGNKRAKMCEHSFALFMKSDERQSALFRFWAQPMLNHHHFGI
jgi:hypothetical protein